MDWLFGFEPVHVWDWVIAQTPASPVPTPTPTALPMPARSPDVELLKSQLEFLKDANNRLSDSFSKFVEAMKFTLLIFGALGGLLAFMFGKNLDDAKKVASQVIRQEVEAHVASQVRDAVNDEIENIRRVLGRERVISSITVDYYLPSPVVEPPDEYKLLNERGFQQVRFRNAADSNPLAADVVVLDLVHPSVWANQPVAQSSEAALDNLRQTQMENLINRTRALLGQSSVLVVYVRPGKQRVKAIDDLATQVRYYASANTPVTLMGVVTDSAYVAYGWRNATV